MKEEEHIYTQEGFDKEKLDLIMKIINVENPKQLSNLLHDEFISTVRELDNYDKYFASFFLKRMKFNQLEFISKLKNILEKENENVKNRIDF